MYLSFLTPADEAGGALRASAPIALRPSLRVLRAAGVCAVEIPPQHRVGVGLAPRELRGEGRVGNRRGHQLDWLANHRHGWEAFMSSCEGHVPAFAPFIHEMARLARDQMPSARVVGAVACIARLDGAGTVANAALRVARGQRLTQCEDERGAAFWNVDIIKPVVLRRLREVSHHGRRERKQSHSGLGMVVSIGSDGTRQVC